MADLLTNVDVPTLRRIALLTRRIGQDDPALRGSMGEVSEILEQMKRHVALGQEFQPSEIAGLKRLLGSVARPLTAGSMIEAAMLDELRDLGRALPAD